MPERFVVESVLASDVQVGDRIVRGGGHWEVLRVAEMQHGRVAIDCAGAGCSSYGTDGPVLRIVAARGGTEDKPLPYRFERQVARVAAQAGPCSKNAQGLFAAVRGLAEDELREATETTIEAVKAEVRASVFGPGHDDLVEQVFRRGYRAARAASTPKEDGEVFSNRPALRQVSTGEFVTEDGKYTIISTSLGWCVHEGENKETAATFDCLTAAGNWIGDQARRASSTGDDGRSALAFYANPANWERPPSPSYPYVEMKALEHDYRSPVEQDGGARARSVLAGSVEVDADVRGAQPPSNQEATG